MDILTLQHKTIISIVVVVLSFIGYGIYVLDVVKRKTTPHVFTWLIWTITSAIIWALQVSEGAGVGSWVTFAVTLICGIIFLLSFKYGEKTITKSDICFLILALLALALWRIANQPVLSIILLTLTEVLGFLPTVRKSWNKPWSESPFIWEFTGFRHGLGIFALQQWNVVTVLFPLTWVFANFAFAVVLRIRRKRIPQV